MQGFHRRLYPHVAIHADDGVVWSPSTQANRLLSPEGRLPGVLSCSQPITAPSSKMVRSIPPSRDRPRPKAEPRFFPSALHIPRRLSPSHSSISRQPPNPAACVYRCPHVCWLPSLLVDM